MSLDLCDLYAPAFFVFIGRDAPYVVSFNDVINIFHPGDSPCACSSILSRLRTVITAGAEAVCNCDSSAAAGAAADATGYAGMS